MVTNPIWLVSESHSIVSNSLWPHGQYSPWNSPGQNTGVCSLSLLQGIFPNPGIKPRFPILQVDSLPAEPRVTGKQRKSVYTERYHGCEHTKETPCENMARRQLLGSQGGRPREKPPLPAPLFWTSSLQNCELPFKPHILWYFIISLPNKYTTLNN